MSTPILVEMDGIFNNSKSLFNSGIAPALRIPCPKAIKGLLDLKIASIRKLKYETFWKLFGKSIYKVICPSDETKELIKRSSFF